MLAFSVIPVAAEDTNAYQINFDGSVQYLAPSDTGKVIVHVAAGPGGNYSWNASVSAGSVTAKSGQGNADNFTVSVTAPSTTGDITLTVTVSGGNVSTPAKYTIHVITPKVITAQVTNSGNLTMVDVPVQFWADGNLLNETKFTIPANSTKTLTYNWTVANLANGEHTVQVVLDPSSQFVRFTDGNKTTFTNKFYVGDGGFGLTNLALVIVFALLLVVVFFSYMNRGKKKR